MLRSVKPSILFISICVSVASAHLLPGQAFAQNIVGRGPEGRGEGDGGVMTIPGDGDSNWENVKKLGKKLLKSLFSGSKTPSPPVEESVANALKNSNLKNSAGARQPLMPAVKAPSFRLNDSLELSFDTEPLSKSFVDLVNREFSGGKSESGLRLSRSNPSPVQPSSASLGSPSTALRSMEAGFPAPIGSFYVFDLNAHRYLSFNSSSRQLEHATSEAVRFGLTEVFAPETTTVSMVNTITSGTGGRGYPGNKVLSKVECEGAANAKGRFFLRPIGEHGAYDGFAAINDRGVLEFRDKLPYVTRERVYYEKDSIPDQTGLYRPYEGWFKEVRRVVDDKEFGRYTFAPGGVASGLELISGHKAGIVLQPTLGSNVKVLNREGKKRSVAPSLGPTNFLFLAPDGLGSPAAEEAYVREGVLLHSKSLRFLNAEKQVLQTGQTIWNARASYAMIVRNWNQAQTKDCHLTAAASEAAFLRIQILKKHDDGQQRLICCIENIVSGRWLGELIPDAPGSPRRVDAKSRKGFIWVSPSKTMSGRWESARYDSAGNIDVGVEKPNPEPQFIDLSAASDLDRLHCFFEIIGVGEQIALLHLASNRLLRCWTPQSQPFRKVDESLSLAWGESELPSGGQWDEYLFRFAVPAGPK